MPIKYAVSYDICMQECVYKYRHFALLRIATFFWIDFVRRNFVMRIAISDMRNVVTGDYVFGLQKFDPQIKLIFLTQKTYI
jgi:hypothetical protein